jgi:hypothetical protein
VQTIDEKTVNHEAHDRLDLSVHVVAADLDKHEAVCAERYGTINTRLTRIETMIMGVIAAIGSAVFALIVDRLVGQ